VKRETVYVDGVAMVRLLGPNDRLLRTIEAQHPLVEVHVRGNEVTLEGPDDDVRAARSLVDELVSLIRDDVELSASDVTEAARIIADDSGARASDVLGQVILTSRGKIIRPKTMGQRAYVDAIDEHTVVFGIGPA